MRQSLSGMFACSLLTVAVLGAACGSDDDKNKPRVERPGAGGDAGNESSGGEAASTASGGATSEAGQGGSLPTGEAGSGSVVPVAGATGDAGAASTAGAAGAGGAGSVTPFNGLYIGPNGDDTAGGTADAPFETLAHAASFAQAGDTIVFLDGAYAVGTKTTIPDGVNLMAENSGAVTLTGLNQPLLSLEGDTRIEGLKFQSYSTVVSFAAAAAATGTVTVVDSSFVACNATCLLLTGSASAVVSADAEAVVGNGGGSFSTLTEEASLTVTGGILQNYQAGGVLRVNDTATLALTDVSVLGGTGNAVLMREESAVTLDGVTAQVGSNVVDQAGDSSLTITGSDLSTTAKGSFHCLLNNMNGIGSIEISDSKLHTCSTAFRGYLPATLTVTGVEVYDVGFGADLAGGAVSIVLRITDSDISDVTYSAWRMGSASTFSDIKVRGTSFSSPVAAQFNLLIVDASNASTVDFGTVGDPGGNTFATPNAARVAMQLLMQAGTVTAVGNTWNADQQGANAQGKYVAPAGSGNKLEITGLAATGRNYSKYMGSTLLLAENP